MVVSMLTFHSPRGSLRRRTCGELVGKLCLGQRALVSEVSFIDAAPSVQVGSQSH